MADYNFRPEWFLDVSDTDSRKKEIIDNEKVLDILHKIVYNIRRKKENVNLADYTQVDWAYKQAHLNGMNEAFRLIESIVNIKGDVVDVP